MAGRFEKWAQQWRLGWNGSVGQSILGAIAAVLGDKAEQWGIYAVRQGLPEYAEEANARAHSAWRGLEPGSSLTAAEVGTLARHGATINRFRGTPLGLLLAFYYADLETPYAIQQNGIAWQITGTPDVDDLVGYDDADTLGSIPSWFTKTVLPNGNPLVPASPDGHDAIAAMTVPWWVLGSAMDADGNQFASRFDLLYDSTATVDVTVAATQARICRVLGAWRPAKALCMHVYKITSGHVWGEPGLTWGDVGLLWGGGADIYNSSGC